jgi:ACS family D-galactonate transporter-like MFS transporter
VVTLLWGVCQMLGAACFNWVALLATRLGLGVVEAPIMPAGVKLLGAWMTPNERGRGACILDGGSVLGTAVGAILMTSLITMFDSWRMAFLITGAGTVVVGIGAWLYIRNRPDEHSGVNAGELVHITAARVATVRTTTDAARQGRFIELLRDRSVIAMNCGWICNCIVFYGLLTWLPNYLH